MECSSMGIMEGRSWGLGDRAKCHSKPGATASARAPHVDDAALFTFRIKDTV